MAKVKKAFFCTSCGYESARWLGKCPACNTWNTFKEELILKSPKASDSAFVHDRRKPERIMEVKDTQVRRILLKDPELNRVLGGGLVTGSLVLMGGEPGIGKSTLLLQFAIKTTGLKVLYVSGEESNEQLSMRAERIGIENSNCSVVSENNLSKLFTYLNNDPHQVVIIDSIQTIYTPDLDSSPGSVSQVTTCTMQLLQLAKSTGSAIWLVGHITKEGSLAGPKVLEHMVDTVLRFEGDRNYMFRLLRTLKNRFGASHELGVYEMYEKGLRVVDNPSGILLSEKRGDRSGIAIAPIMEGARPVLVEVQALVSTAVYGTPQRSATGFETRRLNMLLAVLEKRVGFRLASKDVFVNLTGGIRVDDPSLDLAIAMAILSSSEDIPIPELYCFTGEIGLTGEIRPASHIERRIQEAAKMQFETLFFSAFGPKSTGPLSKAMKIMRVETMHEAFEKVFG
jgi:DNA repair protein RadA/Sms